ncbi:MAG: hypothetical protein KatS3mg044_0930 [Rhodothermaceae bacterium]|nr:MAG: hypothetical protein KatS3mg044_0930 [Rhodothermaceae bacterium]
MSRVNNVIDRIPVKWIVEKYRKYFDVDVSYLFDEGLAYVELVQCPDTGIKKFEPSVVGDEKFYALLSRHEWYYQEDKAEYHTVSRLTKGESVCEIGAGAGAFAGVSGAREYVGLELNRRAVETAQERGVNVRLEALEEHLARVGPDRYGVVCAFQVLEHVPDPDTFARLATRLARPGGWVVFSVPADDSFVGLVGDGVLIMPPHHQTRWPDRALDLLGPRVGLVTRALVYEQLDALHATWAASTLIKHALRGSDHGAEALAGSRAGANLWARATGRMIRMLLPNLNNTVRLTLKGHTVTAIYQKPA